MSGAMSMIFLATEADEGLGHVAPWSGFIAHALAQGYEVHMAAPDVGLLQEHIAANHPVQVWSSPSVFQSNKWQHKATTTARSWPELLVSLGYAQPHALLGAVSAWRSILGRVNPRVVLADYAPALLIAAWTLGIPTLEVGTGFCVAPLGPEFQSFPGITKDNTSTIKIADAQLTSAFNACLVQFGKACISSIRDTQNWPVSRVVLSPAELDPYGVRQDVGYAGLIQPELKDTDLSPKRSWPPIVGYLKANTPGLDVLINQMEQAGLHALIYVAGLDSESRENRPVGRYVTLTDKPFALSEALVHAHVYLSNGGASGLGQALQWGCWPVLVPQQAEQVAAARNLIQRGWASIWLADLPQNTDQGIASLFSPRPKQPRFTGRACAQSTLLRLIEQIG